MLGAASIDAAKVARIDGHFGLFAASVTRSERQNPHGSRASQPQMDHAGPRPLPPEPARSITRVHSGHLLKPSTQSYAAPAMPMHLYGIPNCDTVKKARAWLDTHGIAYAFHDYKQAGVPAANLDRWCGEAGWEKVLNRAGTTFKKLPPEAKDGLDEAAAKRLMMAQPSMIKRPIVEHPHGLLVGFSSDAWALALGK